MAGLFTNLICPLDQHEVDRSNRRALASAGYLRKRAKDEDEDDADDQEDAKALIMEKARRLDQDSDLSEDEKKRRLKNYARTLGVKLKDESADEDSDSDDADDEEDAKRKAIKAVKRALKAAYDEDDEDAKRKALRALRALKDDGDEDDDEDDRKAKGYKDEEDDEMDDDAKRARGVAASRKMRGRFDFRKSGVSFASTIFPQSDGDRKVYQYDITQPETMSAPRRADSGVDALNREYGEAVLERLSGGLSGQLGTDYDDSAIPRAGGIDPWLGDTRTTPNSGARFMPRGDGDKGHIVTDLGNPPARTNQGRADSYTLEQDNIVPEGGAMVPVSLPGGMRVVNPGVSGIRGPSGFAPTFRDGMLSVLKSAPRRPGLFRSIITDGRNAGGSTQPVSKE